MSRSVTADANAAAPACPALGVTDLVAGYGEATVLRGVSLDVRPASVTVLLGANGAGKTTLLRTISGLLPVTSGAVSMFGEEIGHLDPVGRVARGLCHIPEGRGIFPSLTVRDNIQLLAPPGADFDVYARAVEAFPALRTRLAAQAGTLSGGQQQMLAMVAAHLRQPRVLLVDEASLGLAPIVVDELFDFMRRLVSEGVALLVVDQFAAKALSMAEKVLVLRKGEIVVEAAPDDVDLDDLFQQYI